MTEIYKIIQFFFSYPELKIAKCTTAKCTTQTLFELITFCDINAHFNLFNLNQNTANKATEMHSPSKS